MHVPDGFLDGPTSVATGVIAVAGVGAALWRTRGRLDEPTAPLAGLVAAFVFAAQMINFPVGAGTSGHLLGGALAASGVPHELHVFPEGKHGLGLAEGHPAGAWTALCAAWLRVHSAG